MLKIIKHDFLKGYLPGHFLPSCIIFIQSDQQAINPEKVRDFDAAILKILQHINRIKNLDRLHHLCKSPYKGPLDLFKRLCIIIELSMEACGYPPCELQAKFNEQKHNKSNIFQLIGQELEDDHSNILRITNSLISWINSLDKDLDQFSRHANSYVNLLGELTKNAPQDVNTLKFLNSSKLLNIPCRRIAKNIFQFGWGRKSRWLNSSFTDQTSAISANLVRNKLACNNFLKKIGIPVPRSHEVKSSTQAIRLADILGYPVVIKAANLEGGIGVYSDLKTHNDIIKAYEKVKKLSNKIMIEDHIFGKDYRLQVCHDEVYWAIERQGPRVIGNGKNTIIELIDIFNKKRINENKTSDTQFSTIKLDKDAIDYLEASGFNINSVPPSDYVIKLRAANNISGGGTMTPVLNIVHPDNINLAVAIAKYLRLDIAGIDLLIPDITLSWKETKAAVCEVNAQPQISGDRHKYILGKLIKSNGRIPTLLFLGTFKDSIAYQEMLKINSLREFNIGVASSNTTWINNEKLLAKFSNLHQAGLALISNPKLDAIFLEITLNHELPLVFPVDKIDAIVLSNSILQKLESEKNLQWFKELIRFTDNVISLDQEANLLKNLIKLPAPKFKDFSQKEWNIFLEKLLC